MSSFNSDSRILSILNSGENMRAMIDPDNILKGSVTRFFSFSRNGESDSWFLKLSFPFGDEMLIIGISSEENDVLISSIQFISGDRKINIPTIGSKTVLVALGTLSELPVQLKRNLAVLPLESSIQPKFKFKCRSFYEMAKNALFYGIEGGEQDSSYRGNFNTLSLLFTLSGDGKPCSVIIRSISPLVDGKITLSSAVDIYGLNDKKVLLRYGLGMGRSISSECFYTKDEKTIPSLKVAFDLANKLSGLYTKQRRKKTGLGKPRSK